MTRPLSERLQIRPGKRVLVMNAPPDYPAALRSAADNVAVDTDPAPGERYDVVHLFARDKAEVDALAPAALEALPPDGLLWISYPKKSSPLHTDITRDNGWETLHAAGWDAIAQVSVDDTWSALRFRPTSKIKYTPGSKRKQPGQPAGGMP